MLSVEWVQHAIGHGGFHVGEAQLAGEPPLRWVYDCGSRRTARFDTYLKDWLCGLSGQVDWLFISHFDKDHVSGLETLMARIPVADVMVPYLNERELAYAYLHEVGRGNLDRWFVDLVADPAAFFLSRGAERVTFVGGRRSDGDRLTEPGERPQPRKDDRAWRVGVYPTPRALESPGPSSSQARAAPVVGRIEGACEIEARHGDLALRFWPYRAPIPAYLHRGLIKALQDLVGAKAPLTMRPGLGDLAYALALHARSNAGRKAIRAVFESYAGSSNRSSLSVLSLAEAVSGPKQGWNWSSPRGGWARGPAGWMATGDAELVKPPDLDDWRANYGARLDQVRVLALPHHGSDRNPDGALQALCPAAVLTAHARAGSRKHPGEGVRLAAGGRLQRVTEDGGTAVRLQFNYP